MPIAAALPYIAAATTIYSAVTANKGNGGGGGMAPPPPPAAPPPTRNDPQAFTDSFEAGRKARAAIGSMQNIGTSPSGLTGAASTTGKTLLGM